MPIWSHPGSLPGRRESTNENLMSFFRDPDSAFLNELFSRTQLSQVSVEQLLIQKDNRRDTDPSWNNAFIDTQAAELLNLAGKKETSIARAETGCDAIDGLLSAGEPLPGNSPKVEYARFAYAACLAGDRAAFNQYLSVFRALESKEISNERLATRYMAYALSECGDIETAWATLQTSLNATVITSEWRIVLDPIFAHYFSELPAFQSLGQSSGDPQHSV
jgi:hypothetical protein